jgi:hypothetical protein
MVVSREFIMSRDIRIYTPGITCHSLHRVTDRNYCTIPVQQLDTGGEGSFTLWVHGGFMVGFE